MRDLEHPDITRVNLTGYPREEAEVIDRCPQCGDEITGDDTALLYEDHYFCSDACLVGYLIGCGIVERTEVGV